MRFLIFLSWLTILSSQLPLLAVEEDDTVMKALSDELIRAKAGLFLKKHERPYFIGYSINETDSLQLSATAGALTTRLHNRTRKLDVDVRVGDYKLDSSNADSAGFTSGGTDSDSTVPLDDNCKAIRRIIWLETDRAYKRAIEDLEYKKAYLQENSIREKPPDWSTERPVVEIQPRRSRQLNEEVWKEQIGKASAVFRQFDRVRKSQVNLGDVLVTTWTINSEGSKTRTTIRELTVTASCTVQASDGMQLSNSELIYVSTDFEAPDFTSLESKINAMATELTQLSETKEIAQEYRGPVLFEGLASAKFFDAALIPYLLANREHLEENSNSARHRQEVGRRILPTFIDVTDEPDLKEFQNAKLLCGYKFDDECVPAQRLRLVENGFLRTLCTTRSPTRQNSKSNGHCLRGRAYVSNLVLTSNHCLSSEELRNRLIELGKEEGLAYVLIARSLKSLTSVAASQPTSSYPQPSSETGSSSEPEPLYLSKLDLKTGKEEPLRGAAFVPFALRTLRDIDATGNDAQVYTLLSDSQLISVVAPAVLVKEVEIDPYSRSIEKPPILASPLKRE